MLQVTDLERDSNYLKLMEADPELDGADDDSELIGMSERSETLRESAASAVPQATATRALEHQELTVDDRSRSSLQSVISGNFRRYLLWRFFYFIFASMVFFFLICLP